MLGFWIRSNKAFRIYVEGQLSTYPYPPDPDLQDYNTDYNRMRVTG
jgi:hypothetical protein